MSHTSDRSRRPDAGVHAGRESSHHRRHAPEYAWTMPEGFGTRGMPLAMAWFEYQTLGEVYPAEEAFARGTLFPELDKPWLAAKGVR